MNQTEERTDILSIAAQFFPGCGEPIQTRINYIYIQPEMQRGNHGVLWCIIHRNDYFGCMLAGASICVHICMC